MHIVMWGITGLKRRRSAKFFEVFLLSCLLQYPLEMVASTAAADANATLVVYNSRDPESVELAKFYAERRKIPKANLIPLSTPLEETIARAQYRASIETPMRALFEKKGLWKVRRKGKEAEHLVVENRIRYVALIRGIPLRIGHDIEMAAIGTTLKGIPPQVMGRNEASVDSELAALGWFDSNRNGIVPNPYYRASADIISGVEPGLLLVSRLDGPNAAAVRRMITETLEAEERGLAGFAYIDTRSITDKGYVIGDEWIRGAGKQLWHLGLPVIEDAKPDLFPPDFPIEDAACYFGWYREHVAAPFNRPTFRFLPGAVACHIHSFSAQTLRDPSKGWAAGLVMAGAAAVIGNVYEPYLGLTVDLDIFTSRLAEGSTFAESAYAGIPAVSWMSTMVGDPLYRPFAALKGDMENLQPPWRDIVRGIRAWDSKETAAATLILKRAAETGSGDPRPLEVLGLLQAGAARQDEALAAWTLAAAEGENPADASRRRSVLHQVNALASNGEVGVHKAVDLIRKTIAAESDPTGPFALLLRTVEFTIAPPVAIPVTTPVPTPNSPFQ